jgi:hypothetical protein
MFFSMKTVNIFGMGKKKKKSLYKKLIKGNKVMIAALTGVAAGVTLSNILGTEKAKQILGTVEDSIENFASKVSESVTGKKTPSLNSRRSQETVPNT